MSSVFVTARLVVGDPPTHLQSVHVVPVQTAEEAVQVIDNDGVAVLPEGDWEAAERTLVLLGTTPEHAHRQVTQSHSPVGGSIPAHP